MTGNLHRLVFADAGRRETETFLEILEPSIGLFLDRHEDERMSLDYSFRIMPGAYVSSERLAGVAATREKDHVAQDGNDDLSLLIPRSGQPVYMRLPDRPRGLDEIVMRAGDPVLLRGNEERFYAHAPGSHCQVIAVSRGCVSAAVKDLDQALYRGVPQSAALELLCSYARTLSSDIGALDDETLCQARKTLTDLFILALGPTREGVEATRESARTAKLAGIKADIETRLAHPDLSLDWISGRHGLSPRAIRNLFYAEGTNFTDHVLTARLALAYKRLSDPRLQDRNITAIAFECGFGDLSWFNQAFRRRYGMRPSDLRRSGPAKLSA